MSRNLGTLTLDLVAEIGEFKKGIDQATRIADNHARDMKKIMADMDRRQSEAIDKATKGFKVLAGMAASVAAVSTIRGVLDMADSYGQMSARIKLTIEDMNEYDYVQKRLIETANQAQRPLEEIQSIFIDTSGNLRDMGFSLDQAMDIADSFSYALVRNATSAQKAETALRAYDIALNKGRLDGMMWQSVSSAIPSLEISMSKIFDLPLKKIQQMGFEGKITVDMLNKAFLDSYSDNESAAKSMGSTISGSFIAAQNQIKTYIGELNESIGITDKVSSSVGYLGDNVETVMKLMGVAAAGGVALYTSKLVILSATNMKAALTTIMVDIETRKHNLALIEASRLKEKKILSDIKEISSNTSLAGSYSLLTAKTMDYHRALATTQRLQSASRSIFSSITSLLGGPVGIISLMASAATALFFFSGSAKDASVSAGDLEAKLLGLDKTLSAMSNRQLKRERNSFEKDILKAEEERRKLEKELQTTEEMLNTYEERLKLPGYANDKSTLIYIDQLKEKQVDLGGRIDDTSDSLGFLYQILGKVNDALKVVGQTSSTAFNDTSEAFDKMAGKLRDEIGRIGLKSNVAVFEYELKNTDKYADLNPTQIEELRLLNEQKDVKLENLRLSNQTNTSRSKGIDIASEHKRIMESTLSDEERRGIELSKNLDILKQYGASEADMIAVRRAAFESMSVSMPGMGEGGDTLTAQLARIHENMTQLDTWREEQLAKLELAYGNEESALAESLARREEIENDYRNRRSQFEGEMNQELLNLGITLSNDSLDALRNAGAESSGIYKAMFIANKAASFANAIISSQEAGAKALAIMPGPAGIALSKIITGLGMANAGIIAGTAIQGFSSGGYTGHGGKYDPAGIVHRGEVVFSQDDIKRLGGVNAVESIRLGNIKPFFDGGVVGKSETTRGIAVASSVALSKQSSGITVNVINNAPVKVETRQGSDENGLPILEVLINSVVSEVDKRISSGGSTAKVLQGKYGLRNQAR